MAIIDVFNGDADGICALHQLRLAEPQDSILITGVKRDISLLQRVTANPGDKVTVLDISLDKNRDGLLSLLGKGVNVRYFDHHFAGEIPDSENLESYINTDANVCSSLLVNQYLNNQYLAWAVTATFGDNLFESAIKAAEPLRLSETQLGQLKELGTLINYNGYGASLDDLFYPPAELYRLIKPFADPITFINEAPAYAVLKQGYAEDMQNAEQITPNTDTGRFAIYMLPQEKWANRVSGVYANQLAQQTPSRAHAILSSRSDGDFLVSVRAPLATKTGADDVCRRFETGGGRKAAAGINHLPKTDYDRFVAVMSEVFTTT